MINYSLGARASNPGDEESAKKIYAYAQSREVVNIMKLARHIQEHGSPYTRDVIVGVLTKAVDCVREQLLNGNKIQLGEMGAFYVTLSSKGVTDALEFNPAQHIKSVNVQWERGESFKNLLRDTTFLYVTTREQQAAAKKAEKAALNSETGADVSDGDGNDGGGSNDGGDGGDSGPGNVDE